MISKLLSVAGKMAALILMILSLSCGSSRHLQQILDQQAMASPAKNSGFSGIYIYDPGLDRAVYSQNSDKYFIPASNIKLFTFYAGLKMLQDSVPGLSYIATNDSLIFRGTGDPSFLHPEFSYSRTFSFLDETDQNLYLLIPQFEEKRFGPGWAWDDFNSSYSAERSSFPIFGNVATFLERSTDSVPVSRPRLFQDLLRKDSSETGKPGINRHPDQNIFTYTISGEERENQVPFRHSYRLAAHLLEDTLQKQVNLIRNFPGKDHQFQTLYSIPTDSLYKKMLQESDNLIAEQILLLAAGTISDSLMTNKTIRFMKNRYLKDLPQDVKWVDGSGLSRYNLVTPQSIVALLDKILMEVPESRLLSLLPAGGVSGTLKNSYKAENPFIFAKTGSLGNVHNLSGYLRTRSGKILIFSIMNNNFMEPTSAIKLQMEALLRAVYANYE